MCFCRECRNYLQFWQQPIVVVHPLGHHEQVVQHLFRLAVAKAVRDLNVRIRGDQVIALLAKDWIPTDGLRDEHTTHRRRLDGSCVGVKVRVRAGCGAVCFSTDASGGRDDLELVLAEGVGRADVVGRLEKGYGGCHLAGSLDGLGGLCVCVCVRMCACW